MGTSFLYAVLPFMAIFTVGIYRYLQYRKRNRPFKIISKTNKLDKGLKVKIEHIAPIWLRFNDFEPESIKDLPEINLDFIRSSTALPVGQSESQLSSEVLSKNDPKSESESRSESRDEVLVVQSDNEQSSNEQSSNENSKTMMTETDVQKQDDKEKDQQKNIQTINPGFALSFSFISTSSGNFCVEENGFLNKDLFFSPAEDKEKDNVSENKSSSLSNFSMIFGNSNNDNRNGLEERKDKKEKVKALVDLQEQKNRNLSETSELNKEVDDDNDEGEKPKERLNEEKDKENDENEKKKEVRENIITAKDVIIPKEHHSLNSFHPLNSLKADKRLANIKDELLLSLFKDCILPYESFFKQQNAMELVYKLLELLDKHGDCPSVVLKQDSEGKALNPGVVNHLTKVTLKQHTVHVVRFVLDELKKVYQEPEIHIPRAVVMALAHDIGKIPAFHTGDYNTLDHPLIGELQFASLAEGMNIVWKDQVRTAIREHHLNTRDQFTMILKNADRKARGIEMIQCLKDFRIAEFDSWFNLKEFVKKMVPYINVIQLNKWVAVSINGVIYVRPLFLYHLADEYRKEKKIFDSLFIYQNNKDSIVQRIVNKMKKEGIIIGLETNQYCKRYKLTTRHNLKPYYAYLVPIRLESFCVMAEVSVEEIENRKKPTYLALYTIEPASTQKEERVFEA